MLTPEDKDLLVKKEFPSSRLQNNWLALKRVSHFEAGCSRFC